MPVRLAAYYAGYQADEREQRLRDIPRLKAAGFDGIASPFSDADPNCLKAAQLCETLGMSVVLQPNALTPAQFTAKYGGLSSIVAVNVMDDADGKPVAEVVAKRELWKPVIGSRDTFISCRKGFPPQYANICPYVGVQMYTWKEANWLKAWYWEDVGRLRGLVTGRLAVHPFLGMNAVPWSLRNQPDWRVEDREYTPVAQQECAMWLALCQGADDFLFYTAYEMPNIGGLAFPSGRSYILERPIWLEQYKAVFRQIRKYEKYFSGTREPFENVTGTVLGANWTLADGSGLRVTVDVESEVYPRLRFDTFQPPSPPVKTKVNLVVTSAGPVSVEQVP